MAISKGKKRIKFGENLIKDISLFELYEEHLAHAKARRLSKFTIKYYRDNYRILELCLGGDYIVSNVSESTVHQYIEFIESNYSDKTTTLNTRLRYVRNLFNFAHERGYCQKVKVSLVKECRENKNPLTKEQVEKLIAKPKGDTYSEFRMWVITNLVLSTGIRSRNVREVKVNDLDTSNRTLYLRNTKAHKSQTIYLTQHILNILIEWLKMTGISGESPLFPTLFGDEMNVDTIKSAFRRYAIDRGVETSLHILRHTYARDLVRADVNPVIIKELLGHHSLEVTQRYIKLFSDDIRKATYGLDTLAQYQKNRIKLGRSK